MDQRLRLVAPQKDKRASTRSFVRVPGQIVWKDARGSTRLARIVTRDVSDHGVAVDCVEGTPIPLFRLVYFQIDRRARDDAGLPDSLRRAHVLSAVYRVGPCRQATGTPEGYALRLLVAPAGAARSTGLGASTGSDGWSDDVDASSRTA